MVSFGRKKKKPSGEVSLLSSPSRSHSSEGQGSVHLFSNAQSTETKLLTRRQKFLNKVVRRSQKGGNKHGSSNAGPAELSAGNNSGKPKIGSIIPAHSSILGINGVNKDNCKNGTKGNDNKKSSSISLSDSIAAMLPEPIVKDVLQNMSSDSVEIYLENPLRDSTAVPVNANETASVLEERERIRQQLFNGKLEDEEGVEVTAQFPQRTPAESPEGPGNTKHNLRHTRITISPEQSHNGGSDRPEEEKKDDADQHSRLPKAKKDARADDSAPLIENPAALFPAVTKAMNAARVTPVSDQASIVPTTPGAITAAAPAVVSPESPRSNSSLDYSEDQHVDCDKRGDRDDETASLPTNYSFPPNEADMASMATPPSLAETGSFSRDPSQSTRTGQSLSTRTGQTQSTRTGLSNRQQREHLDDDLAIVEFQNNVFSRGGDGLMGRDSSDAAQTWPSIQDPDQDEALAAGFLEVFHCGDDFTEMSESMTGAETRTCRLVDAFYDNACWTYEEAHRMNRPYYDEVFAKKFLHAITKIGKDVLWHLPPAEPSEEEGWSGRSAIMKIKPGSCYLGAGVDPKLEWTTVGGGKEAPAVDSVPLLDVLSISTFNETVSEPVSAWDSPSGGGEEECLFAITTEQGDVHVFEATSPEERDMLVAGLKNVVARLSYHLVVGDAGAALELYNDESNDPTSGELPSLPNPVATMNRISHALLD